jgi:Putative peptidoglycan binding domain
MFSSRWILAILVVLSPAITTQNATARSMGGPAGGGPHHSMVLSSNHPTSFARGRNFFRHDHFFPHSRFVDRDRFFFRHHHRHFFVAFDFAAFGLPWWYPDYLYYGYPYDYAYYDYEPSLDAAYWNNLAVSVQSTLKRLGYFHGRIDGVIGPDSRQSIRAFQAAHGLTADGMIDPKLLKALGISYRNA